MKLRIAIVTQTTITFLISISAIAIRGNDAFSLAGLSGSTKGRKSLTPMGPALLSTSSSRSFQLQLSSAPQHSDTDDDEAATKPIASTAAEKLMEKAAQLRAEIAALEGKTLQQVEQEARDKKELQEEAQRKSKEAMATVTPLDKGRFLNIPETTDQMIAQAARAVEMAYKDGIKRQTVRLALVAEGESFSEMNQWPGGAQQMYREAAKPLTRQLLKELRTSPEHVLPPNVIDQDIWDFDGSALLTAEAQEGAAHDVQALVFANTDVKYSRDIAQIDETMGNRLFLLINPFWRNLDSWGVNLLAPGAKKEAQQAIFDKGFDETYVFLRFSVRGEFCAAIKCYPYDWQLYSFLEDDATGWERPIRLGSSETEPTSSLFTDLLNEREEFKQTKIMRQLQRK